MDTLERARQARAMLDSALFQEARKDLEGQMQHLRRTVAISSSEMHTRLILMEQLADRFFGFFEQLAQTGQMAELELAEEERRRGLIERGLLMFQRGGRGAL